ncbi:hypothetical protein LG296_03395 [Ureibacillus chungkukjangi]|uniref:hypothetical protein n=1 Tax=Ureibacillus chungkukjangi TaxID=1202712 RepID=UPI00384D6311
MKYYYNPEVKYLLINQSKEKETMQYQSLNIKVPKIGPRPPYYIHPRYEAYYPLI